MFSRFNRYLHCTILLLVLAACGRPAEEYRLPTVAVMPSETPAPSEVAAATVERPTLPPTWTPTPTRTSTATPTITHTPSDTPTLTITPTPTTTPTETLTPTPQGDAAVTGENGVNLREGPATTFNPPLVRLPQLTELNLIGRSSDSLWLEVETFDGERGWVYARLVESRLPVASLPVNWVIEPTVPPPPPTLVVVEEEAPAPTAVVAAADVPEFPDLPAPPPVVGGAAPSDNDLVGMRVSARAREIFRNGQAMGNRARVFAKVGDSLTATQPFFIGFGSGQYILGAHGHLQPTIDFYNVPVRDGVPNSFLNRSVAAREAFNAAAILTPARADESVCLPNETPLVCEYRLTRPAVAVIMLGSHDIQLYGVDEFRSFMEQIVAQTEAAGIVPVLTTFPSHPQFHYDRAVQFNGVIREMAARHGAPLIELQRFTQDMPNYGLDGDMFHLSHQGGQGGIDINFNGQEYREGLAARNYLTLAALDYLRRELLTQ